MAAALKQLRHFAPGVIEGDPTQFASAAECDATTFLQVSEAGRYDEALMLYGGPFLNGIHLPGWGSELEEWVYSTCEFLAGRARQALLRVGEDLAATGHFVEAARRAEAAYLLLGAPELEPEELARVHTLLAAGDSAHLGRVRKEAQGFGIELSLSKLKARSRLRRVPDGVGSFAAGKALPKRGTSFIGREVELAEIATQLEKPECSLLTLTRPGGVGK